MVAKIADNSQKIHIFILMFGVLGNAIIGGMAAFLQFHANLTPPKGFGLTILEIGIIWGISAIFGAVSNIFWGAISDRTRTRWGRRKPFMAIFAPITAILLWISVSVDTLFGFELIFWNFFLFTTLKNIFHSAASVPYTTVIPEVVPPEKRVIVSQLSAVVNGIGMALGAVVPTILYSLSDNFQLPFIIAGILLVVLYYISAAVIPAEKYKTIPISILHSLRWTFKDHNYMLFQVGQFLWTLALNIVLFIIPFLAKDLIGVTDEREFGLLFISFLLIAGVFLLVINFLVEKMHVQKKKALMFSLLFTAVSLPFFGLIGSHAFNFVPVLAQAYLFGSFMFIGLIGIFIFPYAIMMALINYDQGMEATYNGVNGLILGLAAIPAGPLGATILLFGYPMAGIFCSLLVFASLMFMARVHVPEHLFQKKKLQESVT